jgi:hypothetical protein
VEGVLAILLIFGTPVFLGAIITWGIIYNKSLGRRQHDKQLQMYERLVSEKLDVIKTAIAMDYGSGELAELDRRLERLIGKDELTKLLKQGGELPQVSQELANTDLTTEEQWAKRLREKQGQ